MHTIVALVFLSIVLPYVKPTCNYNTPVVGILAQSSFNKKYGSSFIPADYVNFYAAAGAQIVPIFINQPQSYYDDLFEHLNAVVLPGGAADIGNSSYYSNALYFMQRSKDAWENDKEVFPIFGTCLGFEAMAYIINRPVDPRSPTSGTLAVNLPVKFTKQAKSSILFENAPADVISQIETPVNANNHMFSILMSTYNSSTKLQQAVNVLGTSVDGDGNEFATIIEGVSGLPWYGTQFHPEKPIFEFKLSFINHDPKTIWAMQYIADRLVTQSRKSCHKFPSHEALHAQDINNYPLTYVSSVSNVYQSLYFFDK